MCPKKRIRLQALLLAAVFTLFCCACTKVPEAANPDVAQLQVSFLNVGQADSELIRINGVGTLLIDAGNNEDGKLLCDYLSEQGVTRIDYLIGTHPHEDHIGGMDEVVRSFEIGSVFLPRIPSDQTPTTATYEDLLTAIAEKGLSVTAPTAGMMLINEPSCTLQVLSPEQNQSYDDLNDYSIVVRLCYGACSFLFCGDAEKVNEKAMLASGMTLKSDVIKVGHHGSKTSSSQSFLKAVDPQYAVISCGKDNSYNHPNDEVVQRLQALPVQILRTDQDGTICFSCDGKTLTHTTAVTHIDGNE